MLKRHPNKYMQNIPVTQMFQYKNLFRSVANCTYRILSVIKTKLGHACFSQKVLPLQSGSRPLVQYGNMAKPSGLYHIILPRHPLYVLHIPSIEFK